MFKDLVLLFPPIGYPSPYPHLAIPSLVGYLQKHGYDGVNQLDLNSQYRRFDRKGLFRRQILRIDNASQTDVHLLQSYEAISGTIPKTLCHFITLIARAQRPRMIGFSLVYPQQVPLSVAMAKHIKSTNPNKILICGGPMVTANIATYVTRDDFRSFDALFVGDGEAPLLDTANQLNSGVLDLSRIRNCYYRGQDKFLFSGQEFSLNPKDYVTPVFEDDTYSRLPLRMSKGCFWRKCAFCTYRVIFDGYIGPKLDAVIHQIKELGEKHDVRSFIFVDDAMPAKVLYDFSNGLIAERINIEWVCSAIFEKKFGEPEVARVLSMAGCKRIFFGLESANERVLRLMRKPNKLSVVIQVLKNLSQHGIAAHLNVMIGFPTEDMTEAQDTIDFLRRHRDIFDNFSLQRFSLEKNSEVYNSPRKFGISRIEENLACNLSQREGLEFVTTSGMNPKQRNFMALKGMVAYKKRDTPMVTYLRKKLECMRYFLANYGDIVQKD